MSADLFTQIIELERRPLAATQVVGTCALGCPRPAVIHVRASLGGLSVSTFVCSGHVRSATARVLRSIAFELEEPAS